jgi:hypothetical protein
MFSMFDIKDRSAVLLTEIDAEIDRLLARLEENDDVDYEQNTYVPGFTFWYAPNSKINLTMAYNFNLQETENKMCVGWYHG